MKGKRLIPYYSQSQKAINVMCKNYSIDYILALGLKIYILCVR